MIGSVNSLCSFSSLFLQRCLDPIPSLHTCVSDFINTKTAKPPAPVLLVGFFPLLPSIASHINPLPLISASDYGWQRHRWVQNKRHPQWGRGTTWKPNAMILCTAALFLECFLSLSGKYTDTFPTRFPVSCYFPVFSKDALSLLQGAGEC